MFPEFYFLNNEFSTKSVLQTIGIFLAVVAFTIALWKLEGDIKNKIKFYIIFFISLPLSFTGGSLVRSLMYSYNIRDVFNNMSIGTHFIGVIMFFLVIFCIVYFIMFAKNKNTRSFIRAVPFFFIIIHFFGRLGCFCYGCCFGKPYNGIFKIEFPMGSVPVATSGVSLPIFPTQLFEAFSMLVIFICTIILYKKQKSTFSFFMIAFGIVIIISESFMYDLGTRLIFGISYPSLISIIFILIGICFWILNININKKKEVFKNES